MLSDSLLVRAAVEGRDWWRRVTLVVYQKLMGSKNIRQIAFFSFLENQSVHIYVSDFWSTAFQNALWVKQKIQLMSVMFNLRF